MWGSEILKNHIFVIFAEPKISAPTLELCRLAKIAIPLSSSRRRFRWVGSPRAGLSEVRSDEAQSKELPRSIIIIGTTGKERGEERLRECIAAILKKKWQIVDSGTDKEGSYEMRNT